MRLMVLYELLKFSTPKPLRIITYSYIAAYKPSSFRIKLWWLSTTWSRRWNGGGGVWRKQWCHCRVELSEWFFYKIGIQRPRRKHSFDPWKFQVSTSSHNYPPDTVLHTESILAENPQRQNHPIDHQIPTTWSPIVEGISSTTTK